MPTYLWSGKDRYGNPIAQRLTTETPEQAKAVLLERGYTDLELHTNDLMEAVTDRSVLGQLSAEQELALRHAIRIPRSKILAGIHKNRIAYVVLCILLLEFIAEGYILGQILSGLALVGLTLYFAWQAVPGQMIRQLTAAAEWHRWKDALALANRLQLMNRWNRVKVSTAAISHHRAKALCGLGDLPAAIREWQQHEHDPDIPHWLYLIRLAVIYLIARQYDKVLECYSLAIAEKPDPALLIAQAFNFLYRKHDAVSARALLDQVKGREIRAIEQAALARCHGLIACEDGDFATARLYLEQALRRFQRRGRQKRGTRLTQGLLCVACAKLGDVETARIYFTESREWLEATRQDELLQTCRSVLNEP